MAGPVGPVNPRFWANLARRSMSGADDAAAHLARLNVAARAQRPANMELGSPLFNRMYRADQAYEQLARGQTANLRHAGGDFARIAGQAIRDDNAAAAAARAGSPLERALQIGPDGQLVAAMLAGGLTAAGGGMAINNAIEDRRKRQEEDASQNAAAVEAIMRRREQDAREAAGYQDLINGFDPVGAEVYIGPDEMSVAQDLADASYPHPMVQRVPNPRLRVGVRDLLDEEDGPTVDAMYELAMHKDLIDGFDPVASQVESMPDPAIEFTEDVSEDDLAIQAEGASELEEMQAEAMRVQERDAMMTERMRDRRYPQRAAYPMGDPSASLDDPQYRYDFHTGQPSLRTGGAVHGATPPSRGVPLPPRPAPTRTVRPMMPRSSGAWQ